MDDRLCNKYLNGTCCTDKETAAHLSMSSAAFFRFYNILILTCKQTVRALISIHSDPSSNGGHYGAFF